MGFWLGPQTSDEQLMLAYKSGDAGAFSTLVQRHRQTVFNFILRYVLHRQRAEDILQETWLKVIRNSAGYSPTAKFTTYLFTVARNLCVDATRKEAFRKTASLDAPLGDDTDRSLGDLVGDEGAMAPDRGADSLRVRPLIERALESLPEEQREVFLLREYQGIAFKEIAEVVGVNENTAKSRMRYALEGLRKRLNEAGIEADAVTSSDGRTVA